MFPPSDLPDEGLVQQSRGHWHPVDVLSLVSGLLLAGYALVVLLGVELEGGIVLPLLLLGVGLAGLFAAVRRDRASGTGT